MNRAYNDNKEYMEAMSSLKFSDEAKARMVQNLLDAQEQAADNVVSMPRRHKRRLPRIAAVGVAAAVVLTVGASDTDNGVTVTADAIIGDKYHYAVTYSIAKDDGTAFDIDLTDTVGDGVLPLTFGEEDTSLSGYYGGAHGGSYFYDADPADNAIQYVETREISEGEVRGHTVRAKFTDLCVFDDEMNRSVIAEGEWSFKFNLDFEDTSVSLPAGQTFDLNGMTATIDEISLSPLALRVDYTVDSELQWDENAQSGQQSEHDSEQMHKYFDSVQIFVNKADGTSIDLSYAGGSISPEGGKTVCQKGDIFSEIIALEDVESVTVQGVEIPVQQ